MTYATNVPLVQLTFSDGFKYYGANTALTVTATVNTPVASITHANGETLTDGQVLPAQAVTDFHVPATRGNGWRAPDGSHVNGWTYDLAVTITATGQPTLVWTSTINPRGPETITPGMGTLTGATTGGGGATAPATAAGAALVQKLEQGVEDATAMFLGDSTGADDVGFVRRWAESLPARYPNLTVLYNRFNEGTQAYAAAPTVLHAPAPDPVVFRDTFTRTGALTGSKPDAGGAWSSDGASWSVDGAKASYTSGLGAIMPPTAAADTRTVKTKFTASYGADGSYARVLVKYIDAQNYIGLTFPMDNKPFLRFMIGGVSTSVATLDSFVVPAGSKTMDVTVALNGTALTASVDGVQLGGTITTAALTHFASAPVAVIATQAGMSLDDFTVEQSPAAVYDSFSRTGPLHGSYPDNGEQPWGVVGTSINEMWTTNGTVLTRGSAGAGYAVSPVPASANRTVSARLGLNYSGGGFVRLMPLFIDTNNYVGLTFPMDNKPFLRVMRGGVSTMLATLDTFTVPTGTVTVTAKVSVDGNTVSATINGATITGTMSATHAEYFASTTTVGLESQSIGATVDNWAVTQPATADGPTVTVWNGHVGGTKLGYQLARLGTMLKPADLTVVTSSHNYLGTPAAEYIAEVRAFLDAVRAASPETGLAVSSQNPRFAPALDVAPHADRMVELRKMAQADGIGYVPGWEAFKALPSSGRKWIKSDGVHPKGVDIDPAHPGYDVWRDALHGYLGTTTP